MARAFLRNLTLVLLPLFTTSAAMAQKAAQPPQKEPARIDLRGDGSEFFRALLHIRGVKPVKEEELATLNNFNDVIVIVLGNPFDRQVPVNRNKNLPRQSQDIPSVVANKAIQTGGAILVASSHHYSFPHCAPGDQITGASVECSNPELTLRGKLPDCPFVLPTSKPRKRGWQLQTEAQKLFNGDGKDLRTLEHVATGTPSYISLETKNPIQENLHPLAYFPQGCKTKSAFVKESFELPPNTAFAVAGDLSLLNSTRSFRFVAMASSKVFSNALLYLASAETPEDQTDNLELSFRVIDYLQGPNQQRKRCVFFDNGKLIDHFDDLARATSSQGLPLPSPPNLGSLQKDLIDKGNSLLDGFQQNDTPNKLINNLLPLRVLALIALWMVSVSACWFMFKRMVGSRKPTDIPPAPTIAGATADPPGVFDRRQKELLRRNNVYEPVRDLVRDFFVSVGIHGEPGPKHPKVRISKVVRKPDSLRLAIKDLWRLAYGNPQVVSVGQWRDLEPYFERVRQAHEEGKWAFITERALAS